MAKLTQPGGEGNEDYSGNKNDSSLKQHGGEGGGASGTVPGSKNDVDFTPSKAGQSGPGRNLSTSK